MDAAAAAKKLRPRAVAIRDKQAATAAAAAVAVAAGTAAAAPPLTARHKKIKRRLDQRGKRAAEPKSEAVIPRNIIHIVLKDKKWVALPHRIGKDMPLPITVIPVALAAAPATAPAAAAGGSGGPGPGPSTGPIFTITDGTVAAAAAASASSSSSTDIALDAQQKANFDKGIQQPVAQFDARIDALAVRPTFTGLSPADQTIWSRLVLIAGFDPYVALRIVCDGAHDYGSLINGFYTRFLVSSVFTTLNGPPPGFRPLINFNGVLDLVLTPQSDKGGGFNAKPEVIAEQLERLNPLEGVVAAQDPLEQCLIGSGMRNGPEGSNCVSVCALACSFGSTGKLPDSITFNLLPHYVEAANKQSVRAFWAQSLPQFMDAAGTPTEDAVALHGAKFVDLTKATLISSAFECNVAPFREFSDPGAQESFTVYNFYGDSKHVFRRGVPIPAEYRAGLPAEGCSLEIFYQGALVATIYAKQSISLNGLSAAVTAMMGRGKSKKTKDPVSIAYPGNPADPSNEQKAQVMMAKQLLDWAQAYFIAFLWHNFGLIFTLVTNDTFLLRVAKWLRLPFVLLMSKNGAKLYCFDPRAMVLDENEKQTIIGNINAFTDAKGVELFAEIDRHINSIFKHDHTGTAVPIIGCLFSRALELKQKIRATVAAITANRDAAPELQEGIAKQFRYLIKQDAYVYLLSKFKDDIETLFSSAISVTRSINSLIAAHTKQEPVVTLSDTLSSIINTMKTFMPTISIDQLALWLTKLPFPILLSRAELQKRIFAALINRATGGNQEDGTYATLTGLIKELNREGTAFTADTVLARLPAAAAGADVPPDAIPVANAFRQFTAIDWGLSTPGEPAYPYYLLLNNAGGYQHPECPALPAGQAPNLLQIPARYDDLTDKQQERVKALGYTEEIFNSLQTPTLFAPSEAAQKLLKRLADMISGIVVTATAAAAAASVGGSRRGRSDRRSDRRGQRGGAYNESFKNITVWDKNNFTYAGLLTKIVEENNIQQGVYILPGEPGAAAPAALTDTDAIAFLQSTVNTVGARSPIAELFYKIEAYLHYCFDYVEESNNNDILIADYTNMLITLSELRLQCFKGDLSEQDLLIELACILLIEDDRFPSVFSTIQYNKGFNKSYIYRPLYKELYDLYEDDITSAELNDLLEIVDDIFPNESDLPEPPDLHAEIMEKADNLFTIVYNIAGVLPPDRSLSWILTAIAGRKVEIARADIASERDAVALGGAGGGGGAVAVAASKAKSGIPLDPLDQAKKALADARRKRENIKPLSGFETPEKSVVAAKTAEFNQADREIADLEKKVKRLEDKKAGIMSSKAEENPFYAGGFRRTRSRIGKKRTTRKSAAASSKSRRTRRRK